MTYAIGKNQLTCSEPRECYQPASILVMIADNVFVEFCEKHANKHMRFENGSN